MRDLLTVAALLCATSTLAAPPADKDTLYALSPVRPAWGPA